MEQSLTHVIAVSCKSSFSELVFSLSDYNLLPMQPRAFVTEYLYSSVFFELKLFKFKLTSFLFTLIISAFERVYFAVYFLLTAPGAVLMWDCK